MGFEFGAATSLDYIVTLYCFFIVVAFVITMEYVIGIMEYFLESSKLYTNMVQMIYKELMLMGLVTFAVIMYEAEHAHGVTSDEEKWLEAIDFSHIFLFFVTFFFVLHAFFLMYQSSQAAKKYRGMFCEETSDLVDKVEAVQNNCWSRRMFNLKFLPLSNVRDRVEFSLIHSLFTSRYLVPVGFDFPQYLSGCFKRFALRTINRSKFTWIALLIVVFLNFIRIQLGLSCAIETSDDDEDRRRLLTSTVTSSWNTQGNPNGMEMHIDMDIDIDINSIPHRSDTNGADGYFISYFRNMYTRRGLSEENECRIETYRMFLICGGLLVLYSFILTMITRIYKIRYSICICKCSNHRAMIQYHPPTVCQLFCLFVCSSMSTYLTIFEFLVHSGPIWGGGGGLHLLRKIHLSRFFVKQYYDILPPTPPYPALPRLTPPCPTLLICLIAG